MSEKVTIELTADEALVLFEWLARSSDADAPAPFVYQSEQRVLWNLEALMEKLLTAPFDPRYDELINESRSRVRD